MSSDRAAARRLRQAGLALNGIDGDVIRVARFLALQAIEHIGAPGAVAVDPFPGSPSLFFLVPVGASANWDMPHTVAYAATGCLQLPPDHKEAPPGPYWLIHRSHGLTRVDELRQALETVAGRPTSRRAGCSGERRSAALREFLGPGPHPSLSPQQRREAASSREGI